MVISHSYLPQVSLADLSLSSVSLSLIFRKDHSRTTPFSLISPSHLPQVSLLNHSLSLVSLSLISPNGPSQLLPHSQSLALIHSQPNLRGLQISSLLGNKYSPTHVFKFPILISTLIGLPLPLVTFWYIYIPIYKAIQLLPSHSHSYLLHGSIMPSPIRFSPPCSLHYRLSTSHSSFYSSLSSLLIHSLSARVQSTSMHLQVRV